MFALPTSLSSDDGNHAKYRVSPRCHSSLACFRIVCSPKSPLIPLTSLRQRQLLLPRFAGNSVTTPWDCRIGQSRASCRVAVGVPNALIVSDLRAMQHELVASFLLWLLVRLSENDFEDQNWIQQLCFIALTRILLMCKSPSLLVLVKNKTKPFQKWQSPLLSQYLERNACFSCLFPTTTTVHPRYCLSFCSKKTQDWSVKCKWKWHCSGCPECSQHCEWFVDVLLQPAISRLKKTNHDNNHERTCLLNQCLLVSTWTITPSAKSNTMLPSLTTTLSSTSQSYQHYDLRIRKAKERMPCPKCGVFKKTGQVSCCAPGGAWFLNCGSGGNANVDHSWLDGRQACFGAANAKASVTPARSNVLTTQVPMSALVNTSNTTVISTVDLSTSVQGCGKSLSITTFIIGLLHTFVF